VKVKKLFRAFAAAAGGLLAAAYPFTVFYFLVIRKAPIRVLSLVIIALGAAIFLASTSKDSKKKVPLRPALPSPPLPSSS